MRQINTATLQERLLAIDAETSHDVASIMAASINEIQQELPSSELGKRLLPFIGDALLTCMEQVKEDAIHAAPSCLKTITTDILEYASSMDATIDTTSKKWRDSKQHIASAIDAMMLQYKGDTASENPNDSVPAPKKRGTLDIKIANSVAGNAKRQRATLDIGTIIDSASWRCMASDVNAEYVLVKEPIEYRGLWRINGKRTTLLTDCFLKIVRLRVPIAASKSIDYAHTIELLNRKDITKKIEVNKFDRDTKRMDAQFNGYGSFPTSKTQLQYFDEAFNMLALCDDVIKQEETDTLGWNITNNGQRIWVMANGCETLDGFITGDSAPFIAPSIPITGNGYEGAIVPAPSDDVMQLLLCELNNETVDIQASLLGLAAYIMYPIGDDAGKLRFVVEIIGKSRRGKSVLLNFMLSLFGIAFKYNKGTLLNVEASSGKGDSTIGRGGVLAKMRYQLVSDFDNKAKPIDTQFEKMYALRNSTNNMYADDAGGGVVSSRSGVTRQRENPSGGVVRTGEYDYALTSLKRDNDSLEARVCTFIWDDANYSNDGVSKKVEKNRRGIYSWGASYRKWIMEKTEDELAHIFDDMQEHAYTLVKDNTWYRDLHRYQCEVIVHGLLLFRCFLMEQYTKTFLIEWIDTHIQDVIASRVTRNKYIYEDAQKETQHDLIDTILDAIKNILHSRAGYLKNSKDSYIRSVDMPINTELLGYQYNPQQKNAYFARGDVLGYVFNRREDKVLYIGFIPHVLMKHLMKELKNASVSISKELIIDALTNAGIVQTSKNRKECQVRIKDKKPWLLVMPFDKLYPSFEDGETLNDIDEDITDNNVVHINTAPSKRDEVTLDSEDALMVEPD